MKALQGDDTEALESLSQGTPAWQPLLRLWDLQALVRALAAAGTVVFTCSSLTLGSMPGP